MISYAQNFEDVLLNRVFAHKEVGFYIDVGAMDPVLESVTKVFYDRGWSGINVEPNQWFYGKLLDQRVRDINLNLAIGEAEETREMFMFEHIGNSTFDESARDRYVGRGFTTTTESIRVRTLAAICRDYVRTPIDFLKLDCEGWENAAIRGADWDRFRPTVLIVESTEPGTPTPTWAAWESFLQGEARYEVVYFDGLNRFYVPRECCDLRRHFETPPNVFDSFKQFAIAVLEQEGEAVRQERDALSDRVSSLEKTLINCATEKSRLADVQRSLESVERAYRDEQAQRADLTRKLADLQVQSGLDRDLIEALQTRQIELNARLRRSKQDLLKAKLWVGQLSQSAAASELK